MTTRSRSTRSILAVALALGLATSLAACSSSSSGGGGGGGGQSGSAGGGSLGSATLKLEALSSDQPGLDAAIADWKKVNPQVKVQAQYYPAGDPFTTTVSTQFAGGNAPDLVWLTAGDASPTSAQAFAKAGYLADLSNESWVSSMYPKTKPQFEYQGKVYIRDFGLQPLSLLTYSTDYFTQHNLQPPTTFSQLLSLCTTIAGQGKTPISWAGASQPVNSNNVAVLAGNTVFAQDPNWLADAVAGKTTFSSTAGWKEAVQQVVDMKNAKCFSPGAAGETLNQMISDFATGQAAMMFTTTGLDGQVLKQDPNIKLAIFAAPAASADSTRITVQAAGGLGISAKSSHKAQAQAFLDFLSTPAELDVVAKGNSVLSPVDATNGNLTGLYAGIKPFFVNNQVLPDPTAQWPNTSFNTNTGATLQGLFTGQKSVDAVLSDMDKFFTAK